MPSRPSRPRQLDYRVGRLPQLVHCSRRGRMVQTLNTVRQIGRGKWKLWRITSLTAEDESEVENEHCGRPLLVSLSELAIRKTQLATPVGGATHTPVRELRA